MAELEPHETIPELGRGHLDIVIVQDWPGQVLPMPEGLLGVTHNASEHSTQLALVAAGLCVAVIPR